ncbi:hypothetical protein Pcac1_g7126 [Phytophthora cactorum]|nr:hypothetical protein Pcac1_g7126 [Phytophthora cactorum]KAG3002198.1 hypothetical protein PC120_g19846 [Phytophthora cactorum]
MLPHEAPTRQTALARRTPSLKCAGISRATLSLDKRPLSLTYPRRKHPVRLFGAFVHIQQTHLDDAKPHRIRATIGDSDQLEYYLRAFVSGDPNGHRVAIVTRVDTYKDVGFPISVDTGEAIPLDMMTKRVADRFSNEFTPEATKWRKIRT